MVLINGMVAGWINFNRCLNAVHFLYGVFLVNQKDKSDGLSYKSQIKVVNLF